MSALPYRAFGLLFLLVALPLAAKERPPEKEPEKPALGASHVDFAAGRLIQTVLPGDPLDAALIPGGGLAVLIEPEDQPAGEHALYLVEGETNRLLGRVSKEIDTLAGVEVGGHAELWLGEPGRIWRWRADGAPQSILEKKGLLLDSVRIDGDRMTLVGVRQLVTYQLSADGVKPISEIDLPVSARRTPTGLEIKTRPVHELPMPDGHTLYAIGPEEVGPQRLRTILLDPAAPPDQQRREIWSRLPNPEKVEHARYVVVDGRPYLVVLAVGSDELNIFEQLSLRILPLREDRTRGGAAPVFAYETETRRWNEPELLWSDVDGDTKTDLLLIEPQGMGGDDLWLTALPGKGGVRYDASHAVRIKLDTGEGRWTWGHDLDGDGQGDFLVSTGGTLRLFSGKPGLKVIAPKPAWSVEAPSFETSVREVSIGTNGARATRRGPTSAPQVLQLDQDPRPEILLVRRSAGRAVIRVYDLR